MQEKGDASDTDAYSLQYAVDVVWSNAVLELNRLQVFSGKTMGKKKQKENGCMQHTHHTTASLSIVRGMTVGTEKSIRNYVKDIEQ